MTSSLVFAWILIVGIAAIGVAVLGGLVALLRSPVVLLRRPGGSLDVKS